MSTRHASERHALDHPAELGVWLFVFADLCIFAMYFGVFVWEQSLQPELFAQGQATLNKALGALNTVLLLLSSFWMASALRAARAGAMDSYRRHLASTMLCGLVFLVVKFFEYREKFEAGFHIATNAFYRNYFAFTGFHMLHVMIGLSFLVCLLFFVKQPAQAKTRIQTIEGVGLYWHMVDLLWVILFSLIYLVPSP